VDRDGLYTNDKFCFVRDGKLKLNWWRSPLAKRDHALAQRRKLQEEHSQRGVYDEDRMENSTDDGSAGGREAAMGHRLPSPAQMDTTRPREHAKAGGES
jgi:hypothetical protein